MVTPVVLGVLALVLAGPAPALLARASWPHLVPRATAVLWQALALAAVLAALGAGLALATGLLVAQPLGTVELVLYAAVLVLTVLVAGRLAWAVVSLAVHTRSRRRRHRALVDLLAQHDGLEPGLRVLAEQTPVVYCLPAVRDARVVLSAGALAQLDPDELGAVLAHERAHLRARHDLVLEAFGALRHAFPRFVRSHTALEQNRILVELLADDAARRRVGAAPLARALVKLADGSTPEAALAAACQATVLRVNRLAEPTRRYDALAAATYAAAIALVALPTVFVAVPWLADVLRALVGA
ncbi:MAG: M48 family metalloprotease [Streptosporangiales bacterium]|nr:M48 family metalloprotease [Streptosporangiales bacterium]